MEFRWLTIPKDLGGGSSTDDPNDSVQMPDSAVDEEYVDDGVPRTVYLGESAMNDVRPRPRPRACRHFTMFIFLIKKKNYVSSSFSPLLSPLLTSLAKVLS